MIDAPWHGEAPTPSGEPPAPSNADGSPPVSRVGYGGAPVCDVPLRRSRWWGSAGLPALSAIRQAPSLVRRGPLTSSRRTGSHNRGEGPVESTEPRDLARGARLATDETVCPIVLESASGSMSSYGARSHADLHLPRGCRHSDRQPLRPRAPSTPVVFDAGLFQGFTQLRLRKREPCPIDPANIVVLRGRAGPQRLTTGARPKRLPRRRVPRPEHRSGRRDSCRNFAPNGASRSSERPRPVTFERLEDQRPFDHERGSLVQGCHRGCRFRAVRPSWC